VYDTVSCVLMLQVNKGPRYCFLLTASSNLTNFTFSLTSHNFGCCFIQTRNENHHEAKLVFTNNEKCNLRLVLSLSLSLRSVIHLFVCLFVTVWSVRTVMTSSVVHCLTSLSNQVRPQSYLYPSIRVNVSNMLKI
jgi:hypothetical protein